MKMKSKAIIAALAAAGIVAPLSAMAADTITGTVTPPTPQAPVPASGYTVTYPVTVQLTGGSPQNLNFVYNGATGQWTAPAGWVYDAALNPNANTAVFTTTQGGVSYGVALSSTGSTQFVPSAGTPATTTAPSVNLAANAVTSGLSGFGSATASGSIAGFGQTTAPLVPAPATAQIIGVGAGGAPVGTICVDNNPASGGSPACSAGPIAVTPTTGTSPPGKAGGAVTVNSNQPNQSIGWGQYTATFPTTNTPTGTATINGTVAGSSGSVGSTGIFLNNITGTATYCTGNPGSSCTPGTITANPTVTSTFSVLPNGNTAIGGTLSVAGQTTTNGLGNNGAFVNNGNALIQGNLGVSGVTTTNGISNNGTLVNNGNVNVTGNTTIGGTLTSGAISAPSLGITGNATIGGTLGVGGSLTVGSTSGTGGNTITVGSSGIVLTTPGVGANNVTVNSSGSSITGGGATLAMANGRATFAGANTSPITVTGVANGSNQFDAVNFGQLDDLEKQMSRGIAATGALMNIPQVEQNKTFALGVGVGGFNGETGWAIGGSLRVAKDGIIKARVGGAGGGGSKAVWGVGGGWSWQ